MIFLAWKSLTQPATTLPSALFSKPHTTSSAHKPTPHATSHTTHNPTNNTTVLTLHPPSSAASVASSTNTSVRSHNPYISETESENTTPRGELSRADSAHSMDTVSTIGDEIGGMYSRSKVPALGGAGGVASLASAHQRWPRSMGEGRTKSRPEAMARFTQRGVLCMAMRLSAVMYCIK